MEIEGFYRLEVWDGMAGMLWHCVEIGLGLGWDEVHIWTWTRRSEILALAILTLSTGYFKR